MSKASEFKEKALTRPEFIIKDNSNINDVKFFVTDEGDLRLLYIKPYMSSEEALKLGNWLIETFSDEVK